MNRFCHNALEYLLWLFGLEFLVLFFFTLPPAPETSYENQRLGARAAEPCLQIRYKRRVPVFYVPEISLQNLTIGFGNCLVLLLLLTNAKEEIKLLFILYPSNLGKFLLKSLKDRALLNPLKIGARAPGRSVVKALCVLGSGLAALQAGEMVEGFFCLFVCLFVFFFFPVYCILNRCGVG